MSVYTHPVPRALPQTVRHLGWFALVCVVAFLVPYLGVSVLGLQRDVFYLVYFVITLALIVGYGRVEQVAAADVFRNRWRWSLGIGVAMAARSQSASASVAAKGWIATSRCVLIQLVSSRSSPGVSRPGAASSSPSGCRSAAASVRRNVDPRMLPRRWLAPIRPRRLDLTTLPDGHFVAPVSPA